MSQFIVSRNSVVIRQHSCSCAGLPVGCQTIRREGHNPHIRADVEAAVGSLCSNTAP